MTIALSNFIVIYQSCLIVDQKKCNSDKRKNTLHHHCFHFKEFISQLLFAGY